jgi:hypothetical protein
MKTEKTKPDSSRYENADVKSYSARELLEREGRTIEVPENSEVVLSPANPEYADSFARVRLQSFEDLQLLGFVPRRLSPEKVRTAMAADDAEAFKLATATPVPPPPCHCHPAEPHSKPGRTGRGGFRPAYLAIRNRYNPALAKVISEHLGTTVQWDDSLVGLVRKWDRYAQLKPFVYAILLDDIVINRNATLSVAAASHSLLAGRIWIHRTGKLTYRGRYLKIWASSIESFEGIRINISERARTTPPWAVNL